MAEVTAALITGQETLELQRFPRTSPPPGCITVDISLCGICGTDIASFRSGPLQSPALCGTEWAGTGADAGVDVDNPGRGGIGRARCGEGGRGAGVGGG